MVWIRYGLLYSMKYLSRCPRPVDYDEHPLPSQGTELSLHVLPGRYQKTSYLPAASMPSLGSYVIPGRRYSERAVYRFRKQHLTTEPATACTRGPPCRCCQCRRGFLALFIGLFLLESDYVGRSGARGLDAIANGVKRFRIRNQ